MDKKLKSEIYKIVENTCKSKDNHFGYGAWEYHIKFVIKYAKLLAKKLKADEDIVEIAALLHDFACVKDRELYNEHHIGSAKLAEELLRKYKYPEERIERVKYCILTHRGSRKDERKTVEARILTSADAMAHFDSINNLLFLAYTIEKKDTDEGTQWVMAKLKRSWDKLMPEAKEIMMKKYEAIKIIFENNSH